MYVALLLPLSYSLFQFVVGVSETASKGGH